MAGRQEGMEWWGRVAARVGRQAGGQTGRQPNGQAARQAGGKAGRQAGRQTGMQAPLLLRRASPAGVSRPEKAQRRCSNAGPAVPLAPLAARCLPGRGQHAASSLSGVAGGLIGKGP